VLQLPLSSSCSCGGQCGVSALVLEFARAGASPELPQSCGAPDTTTRKVAAAAATTTVAQDLKLQDHTLKRGDIILAINGKKTQSAMTHDLQASLEL
ncbi:unnamed protein product, partial [Symbiodinium necroappetens]